MGGEPLPVAVSDGVNDREHLSLNCLLKSKVEIWVNSFFHHGPHQQVTSVICDQPLVTSAESYKEDW